MWTMVLVAMALPASRVQTVRAQCEAWAPLGTGVNLPVESLTTLPNGDLVAGGFTMAGGVAVNNIARWDGANWSALGAGMNGIVISLTTLPNGDLIAGGGFTMAGGAPASNIARWDGTNWSALGMGTDNFVAALTTLPNGDLVAGGRFTTAGGVPANGVARWDGTNWIALGLGVDGPLVTDVRALTTLPNGDLVAGGNFTMAGGVAANRIARWDGTNWSALGTGMNDTVWELMPLPNGDLIACGLFTTAGGTAASRIARWDGTNWSALGTGMNNPVYALTTLPNGDLIAGGLFTLAGGTAASLIARWDGMNWTALGAGMNGAVFSLTTMPNGEPVAGGFFTMAGDVAANSIARFLPVIDLAITKTDGQAVAVPGQTVTYTITVTNNALCEATGATVTDSFPAVLTGVSYTSVVTDGASGNTAMGNGDINDIVTMPAGSTITYTATGTVMPGTIGTLDNTATVTAPAGVIDPDLTNNTATDSDLIDTDGDGTADVNDGCPNDPNKTMPGMCGCGTADTDTDNDGTLDCNDACPNDPTKIMPGVCGCGTPDTDTDNDGTLDCNDACPNDATKIAAGVCGCGNVETDANNNGVADCIDPTIGPCPADITVTADSNAGIAVDFMLPAGNSPIGNVNVSSDPPVGSILPLGASLVTITATDGNGVTASCTFNVTVLPQPPAPQAPPPACNEPLQLLISVLFRAPICGTGACAAMMMTIIGLMGTRRYLRRRRR